MYIVLKDNSNLFPNNLQNQYAGYNGQYSNTLNWNNTNDALLNQGTVVRLNNRFNQDQGNNNLYPLTGNLERNIPSRVYNVDNSTGSNLANQLLQSNLQNLYNTAGQVQENQLYNPLTGQLLNSYYNNTLPLQNYGWNQVNTQYQRQQEWTQNSFADTLRVNFSDNDSAYVIECYSPEFDAKNSEVTLTPNGLRIRINNQKNLGKGYNYQDQGFYTIPTPCDVDNDKISAQSSKGYLKINLPRSKKALESIRKIKVD